MFGSLSQPLGKEEAELLAGPLYVSTDEGTYGKVAIFARSNTEDGDPRWEKSEQQEAWVYVLYRYWTSKALCVLNSETQGQSKLPLCIQPCARQHESHILIQNLKCLMTFYNKQKSSLWEPIVLLNMDIIQEDFGPNFMSLISQKK